MTEPTSRLTDNNVDIKDDSMTPNSNCQIADHSNVSVILRNVTPNSLVCDPEHNRFSRVEDVSTPPGFPPSSAVDSPNQNASPPKLKNKKQKMKKVLLNQANKNTKMNQSRFEFREGFYFTALRRGHQLFGKIKLDLNSRVRDCVNYFSCQAVRCTKEQVDRDREKQNNNCDTTQRQLRSNLQIIDVVGKHLSDARAQNINDTNYPNFPGINFNCKSQALNYTHC